MKGGLCEGVDHLLLTAFRHCQFILVMICYFFFHLASDGELFYVFCYIVLIAVSGNSVPHHSGLQSGAIMCLLGSVCVSHPDSQLSIAFVSSVYPHSFSANSVSVFLLSVSRWSV